MSRLILATFRYLRRKTLAVLFMLIAVTCVLAFLLTFVPAGLTFLLTFVPAGLTPNGGWNLPGRLLEWKEGWERLAWHHWEG